MEEKKQIIPGQGKDKPSRPQKPKPYIEHGNFEKRDDHSRILRPIKNPNKGDDD